MKPPNYVMRSILLIVAAIVLKVAVGRLVRGAFQRPRTVLLSGLLVGIGTPGLTTVTD